MKHRNQPAAGRRNASGVYSDAVRDVMMSLRPGRQQIRRARRQGIADYGQYSQQAADIGQAFQSQVAPLGGAYDAQVGGITSDLQAQLGSLTGLLGTSIGQVPEAERAAGAAMFGTTGAGTLAQLASERARQAGYQTSAQRQGAIETMTTRRNALVDLQNYLDDLASRKTDLYAGSDAMIRQREDQLRQQAFDRAMAMRNYNLNASQVSGQNASDAAFGAYLQQLLGRLFAGPRGRRRRGGNGRGSGMQGTGGPGVGRPRRGKEGVPMSSFYVDPTITNALYWPGGQDPTTQQGSYVDAQGNVWLNGINYGPISGMGG